MGRLIRRLIMKILSTLIAIASAGQLMKDNDGTILNWHGPHGGHHGFFEGAPYHHGGHGGPRDAEGQEIHGHGPHGGHPKSQMVNYADVMKDMVMDTAMDMVTDMVTDAITVVVEDTNLF